MEITAIINTHGKPDVTIDTIDSVRHYMTNQILVVVDEVGWELFDTNNPPAMMLKGFYHNFHRSAYRNMILGLSMAYQCYPNSDWYCYLEYDCLIGSSAFKKDLMQADMNNVWCVGSDFRRNEDVDISLIELMLHTKFKEVAYLLGAIFFFNQKYMQRAREEDFFEKLLFMTNEFKQGYFPGYHRHDLGEHLMPTLALHWGGEVAELVRNSEKGNLWTGNWRRYPIRFRPDIEAEEEFVSASLLHPLKEYNSLPRNFHRAKRERAKLA